MFKEVLEQILERADGSIGALIMGTDGIAVEKILRDEGIEQNIDVAAAEFTSLVRLAQRSGTDTGLGNLRELVVSLETANVVMRFITREYFLIIALRPDGNLGRARFELQKAELKLSSEFVL